MPIIQHNFANLRNNDLHKMIMDLKTIIQNRYSVRSYQSTNVEEDKLMKILEAARLAPSAVNSQPWHFVVIRNPENRKEMANLYPKEWLKKAPVYILICGNHHAAWKRPEDGKDHTDIDAAIAIDHMTLQATELGLGTCWICNFRVEECKKHFRLPNGIEPIAILSLGYPADKVSPKKRKTLDEIVHWEQF